jgi:hypothetical protein
MQDYDTHLSTRELTREYDFHVPPHRESPKPEWNPNPIFKQIEYHGNHVFSCIHDGLQDRVFLPCEMAVQKCPDCERIDQFKTVYQRVEEKIKQMAEDIAMLEDTVADNPTDFEAKDMLKAERSKLAMYDELMEDL